MSTNFEFEINDDLQVNDDYKGQSNSIAPPKPGNYVFRAEKWDFKRKKDGTMTLYKDKSGNPTYPVIGLTTLEIVDPIDAARKVVVFQDVPSNPFERDGQMASQAADLMRSLDATQVARNSGEVVTKVADALNAKQEFRARLDYKAYDKEYAARLLAELGPNADPKAKGDAYRKAEIRGYKKIKSANVAAGQGALGITRWVGPSGNVVDVQPMISRFYPSNDETVKIGPDAA